MMRGRNLETDSHVQRAPVVEYTAAEEAAMEERRVAYSMVHRVLLAPVTHVSPANRDRPNALAKFTEFATIAHNKVTTDKACSDNPFAKEVLGSICLHLMESTLCLKCLKSPCGESPQPSAEHVRPA